MKEQGLTKVKLGGLEVELAPSSIAHPKPAPIPQMIAPIQPTPEEFLLWSADSAFEEPEAKK